MRPSLRRRGPQGRRPARGRGGGRAARRGCAPGQPWPAPRADGAVDAAAAGGGGARRRAAASRPWRRRLGGGAACRRSRSAPPASTISASLAPIATSAPSAATIAPSTPSTGDFDLHRRLVGLELDQRFACLDRVAGLLQPAQDLGALHGGAELGDEEIHRGASGQSSAFTVAAMRSGEGIDGVFERRAVRHRIVRQRHPRRRRVEIVEGGLGDLRRDLGGPAADLRLLLDGDEDVGLLHALDDRAGDPSGGASGCRRPRPRCRPWPAAPPPRASGRPWQARHDGRVACPRAASPGR